MLVSKTSFLLSIKNKIDELSRASVLTCLFFSFLTILILTMSQQQAKIVQECMAKLTEKFASKIEATVTRMFEGLIKAHAEAVAALKHEILQLKDS